MWVDPECARRVIGWNLDHVHVFGSRANRQGGVVARQRTSRVQPVKVEVGDVRPLRTVGAALEAEPVAESNSQRVSCTYPERRTRNPAAEGPSSQAVDRTIVIDHPKIERDIELACSRCDHRRLGEAATIEAVNGRRGGGRSCCVVRRHRGTHER